MAVEELITPHRKAELHARLLAVLQDGGETDPAVLAHHAEGAGDLSAVRQHALAAARRAVCPDVRDAGLPHESPLVVYVSDQVHHCVDKSADLLGFGRRRGKRVVTVAAED